MTVAAELAYVTQTLVDAIAPGDTAGWARDLATPSETLAAGWSVKR